MKEIDKILTEERLEYVRSERAKARESAFEKLVEYLDADAIAELRKFYDSIDERTYIWYAGLWDREAGGFYYSNSARDTNLYGPDMESTAQAILFFKRQNMIRQGENIPDWMNKKVIEFFSSRQDEDGYFYNPQWGKTVNISRRGRDFCWAKNYLAAQGVSPRYPLATARSADGTKSKSLPDYLQSIEAFREYLSGLDITHNSYGVGNLIDSTCSQITAAGPEFKEALIDFITSHQRSDNGIWEKEITYASINGLMKLSGNYKPLGITLAHSDKALESAIAAVMSDERMKFVCEVYNPWSAITFVFRANEAIEGERNAALRETLRKDAAAMIKKTREKVEIFMKPDGSCSYFKRMSASISQGAPAAVPRTNEGDVNATGICISGTFGSMFSALAIPPVPVYCPADGDLLFELIENAPRIEKKYDIGDTFPDRVPYEEEIAE